MIEREVNKSQHYRNILEICVVPLAQTSPVADLLGVQRCHAA